MHELVANAIDPVYVLHSEHPILIERAVAAIRDAAVPPEARGFNYDVVEGKPKGAHVVVDPDALVLRRSIALEAVAAWKSAQAAKAKPQ